MTFQQVAQHVKDRLGLPTVRVVGDPNAACQTVGILPGAPGGRMQIGVLEGLDVLIAGEIDEWETSEYVRDAVRLGYHKGLIVTGHAASEEPGMRWVIPWLQERLPGIPIDFLPTGSAFRNF
jgi:putative NIF3 family GTP cyclohydrolase 1 type 2